MTGKRHESDLKVRTRILQAAGANLVGQIIHAVTQFATVALIVNIWSVEQYGDWIKLFMIPSVFAVATTGFGSVAANRLTMDLGNTSDTDTRQLFQTTLVLICLVSCMLAIIAGCAPLSVLMNFLGITELSEKSVRFILLCFVGQFAMQQLLAFLSGCYRSLRCVVRGIMWINVGRLTTLVATGTILLSGGTPVSLAVGMTAATAVVVTLMAVDLGIRAPLYRVGFVSARWSTFRWLVWPSIMFNAIPLGHAIRQQGVVLLIARLLSNEAVVSFNAMRTLSNAASQLISLTQTSVSAEFSLAFGDGNTSRLRMIHRRSCQLATLTAISSAAALMLVGPALFRIWTSNQVVFDHLTFAILLAVLVARSLWMTSSVIAIATNRHQRLAAVYAITSVSALILGLPLIKLIGMRGAATCVLCSDLLMAWIVVSESLQFTEDSRKSFFIFMAKFRHNIPFLPPSGTRTSP